MPKSEVPHSGNNLNYPRPQDGLDPNDSIREPHSQPNTNDDNRLIPPVETAEQVPAFPKEKKQMNPWFAGGIGLLTGGIVTALVLNGTSLGTDSAANEAIQQLEDAVTLCDDPAGILISDEGRSLLFDTKGEEDRSGAAVADFACILAVLDVPAHVVDKMERTTALAGSQSASWNNFEAEWSYHPDRGLDGVLVVMDSE